ncbi:hybrid sensor histidine kinase/response regulator [Burkholderia pseudomultivorans]|uniref:Virulence sensor protein BvgS n=1 Tax=Burkholderia pseudomultivorans TaxID=1207504 RepID=A0A132EMJ3_9BURK|nr:hybrid sensor histidine kinase/response regulator [Burkholderia pseudomultivorans]KWF35840.1 hypothetical protein WT56_07760 [Burkholderia pseudomultivorans]
MRRQGSAAFPFFLLFRRFVMPSLRQSTLVQIRRYQRLLTYGAGAAITVLLLLAFALIMGSLARSVLLDRQQNFVIDRSLVMSDIEAREAMLRHAVVSAQLAWHDGAAVDDRLVERFRSEGGKMVLRPSRSLTPQLVFVNGHPKVKDTELRRYLGLAVQMAHSTTASSLLRGKLQTGYYYSARRDFAALTPAPAPVDARVQEMLVNRDALMRVLDTGLEKPSLAQHFGRADYPRLHWLPPAINPFSGEHAVRLASVARDGDEPFAVLVTEHDPQAFLRPVALDKFGGTFMIIADDRSVIASYAKHQVDHALVERVRNSREATHPDHRLRAIYRNGIFGVFTISDQLGDTGWNLVYAFSLIDILRVIWVELVATSVATGLTIAALWVLLLLFSRRKFAPAYAQSQRVFDNEQLSRTLIETAPVGLGLIACADARLLLASPMMEEMASRAKLSEGTLPSALVNLHREQAVDGVAQAELPLETVDGGRVDLSVSTMPARYQGQAALVVVFADVTARRQIEHELRVAKQAADDASAAKSIFLATMSHEIRTPLNAFLGNLELLAHTPLNPKQQDRLATIRAAADSLLSTISDVLDFAKIEAGEMSFEYVSFPVLDVLDRSLAVFAPAARAKGLRLRIRTRCSVDQTMQGDPTRFGQILNNLLGNAIKFTERGTITVDVVASAGWLGLVVEDTGIGMTKEQRARLFEPFAQADQTINRRFGGTGLGLALCRRLSSAMGGEITVASRFGMGSRFTVRLPLGASVSPETRVFGGLRGPAILISADVGRRKFIVEHLRAWGLDVRAYGAPADVDTSVLDVACVVILHDPDGEPGWCVDDENRLVEAARRVVTAGIDGPWRPMRAGRIVDVTCDSVRALQQAVRLALTDDGYIGLVPPEPAHQALDRRLKVLVAEDNAFSRTLLAEQLALLGCDADVVPSGGDALTALKTQRWDVLLTDINMPDISGYTLAKRALAMYPTMSVIAVTAQATLDDHERCAAAGIARVVTKPLSLAGLRTVLETVTSNDTNRDLEYDYNDGEPSSLLAGRPLPAALLALFQETSAASLEAIRTAMRDGAKERALAELHSLKGMLGVFRADGLAQRCAQLERMWEERRALDERDFDALASEIRALADAEPN